MRAMYSILACAVLAGACGDLDNKKDDPKRSQQDDQQTLRLAQNEQQQKDSDARLQALQNQLDQVSKDSKKRDDDLDKQNQENRAAMRQEILAELALTEDDLRTDYMARVSDAKWQAFKSDVALGFTIAGLSYTVEKKFGEQQRVITAAMNSIATAKEELNGRVDQESKDRAAAIAGVEKSLADKAKQLSTDIQVAQKNIKEMRTTDAEVKKSLASIDGAITNLAKADQTAADQRKKFDEAVKVINESVASLKTSVEDFEVSTVTKKDIEASISALETKVAKKIEDGDTALRTFVAEQSEANNTEWAKQLTEVRDAFVSLTDDMQEKIVKEVISKTPKSSDATQQSNAGDSNE